MNKTSIINIIANPDRIAFENHRTRTTLIYVTVSGKEYPLLIDSRG